MNRRKILIKKKLGTKSSIDVVHTRELSDLSSAMRYHTKERPTIRRISITVSQCQYGTRTDDAVVLFFKKI